MNKTFITIFYIKFIFNNLITDETSESDTLPIIKKNLKKAPLKRKSINKSPIENDSSSDDKSVKKKKRFSK